MAQRRRLGADTIQLILFALITWTLIFPFVVVIPHDSKFFILPDWFRTSSVSRTTKPDPTPFCHLNSTIPEETWEYVVRLAERHVEPVVDGSPSVAMCIRPLFNPSHGQAPVDLKRVLLWTAYHRLLGLDHFFLYYLPMVQNNTYFDRLSHISYITMLPFQAPATEKGNYGQGPAELYCRAIHARNFDWVLVADADEFLWFKDQVSVKEFIQNHSQYRYMSFGKQMYTLKHRALNIPDLGLMLNQYPFHAGPYCYSTDPTKIGHPECPAWPGRAKVMAMPRYFNDVGVHGGHQNDPEKGIHHFHIDEAHLKEWNDIYQTYNVTVRDRADFSVRSESEVEIHGGFKAHQQNNDGSLTMKYDSSLQDWFRFVISRASC